MNTSCCTARSAWQGHSRVYNVIWRNVLHNFTCSWWLGDPMYTYHLTSLLNVHWFFPPPSNHLITQSHQFDATNSFTRQLNLNLSRRITIDTLIKKTKDVALKEFVQKILGELHINKTYLITAMATLTTKYGSAVLCWRHCLAVSAQTICQGVQGDQDEAITTLHSGVVGLTISYHIKLANGTTTYVLTTYVVNTIHYCNR